MTHGSVITGSRHGVRLRHAAIAGAVLWASEGLHILAGRPPLRGCALGSSPSWARSPMVRGPPLVALSERRAAGEGGVGAAARGRRRSLGR